MFPLEISRKVFRDLFFIPPWVFCMRQNFFVQAPASCLHREFSLRDSALKTVRKLKQLQSILQFPGVLV